MSAYCIQWTARGSMEGPANGVAIVFHEGVDGGRRSTVGAAHLPLRQAVLDGLRAAIISGQFQPGERLLEEEIAATFDVSRNPIREALHALSLEGFVTIEPRRGARVALVDARRARELFELRLPLEGLVAQLAAERRDADELAALEDLVATGRAAVAAGQLDELPALNTRFHQLLAGAADNELLAATLQRLSHVIQWVYASRIRDRSGDSWAEHGAIVDAIAAGDGRLARQRGESHIAAARDAYLRLT